LHPLLRCFASQPSAPAPASALSLDLVRSRPRPSRCGSWIVLPALLLLAAGASASPRSYQLDGDQSTLFPTDGTTFRPDVVSGSAVIDDAGDGTPSLVELYLYFEAQRVFSAGEFAPVPGSTVSIDWTHRLSVAPDQTGSGSTTSSISWGTLTGWTNSGTAFCETHCPGGCGGSSACVFFVGFEGTGPTLPLESTEFDSDPWTFASDGSSFEAQSIEIVSLGQGAVTESVVWRGAFRPGVPALSLLAVAGLGACLVAAGARALRRRGSGPV
jgi:hypothetical protein